MVLTMDNRARPLPTFVRNGTGANFRACPDTEITNLIPKALYRVRNSVPLASLKFLEYLKCISYFTPLGERKITGMKVLNNKRLIFPEP